MSLREIRVQKRNVPIDQIIAVQGQNPLATGIEAAGNTIGQAIAKRQALIQQGQQLAELAKMAGQPVPDNASLSPELYEKGLTYKTAADQKKAEAAKQRVDLELKLEQLRSGYKEIDPTTGATRVYPGVQGLSIDYDNAGNPVIKRDESYKPKEQPSKLGGGGPGSGVRGSYQQSTYVDSADGTPLLFDRDGQRYIRSDNQLLPKGTAVPTKGAAEAVQSASRGAELLPKIDLLFNSLNQKSALGARLAVSPLVGPVAYPEITQLKNELKQVGFTFGGKNFTGNEEKIITGAMVPGPLDSQESREAKRNAIKGYVSGQMDLYQAANLLGPAGDQIKAVLQKAKAESSKQLKPIPSNETSEQRKARLIQELRTSKP
jgi:hypothetical protein